MPRAKPPKKASEAEMDASKELRIYSCVDRGTRHSGLPTNRTQNVSKETHPCSPPRRAVTKHFAMSNSPTSSEPPLFHSSSRPLRSVQSQIAARAPMRRPSGWNVSLFPGRRIASSRLCGRNLDHLLTYAGCLLSETLFKNFSVLFRSICTVVSSPFSRTQPAHE